MGSCVIFNRVSYTYFDDVNCSQEINTQKLKSTISVIYISLRTTVLIKSGVSFALLRVARSESIEAKKIYGKHLAEFLYYDFAAQTNSNLNFVLSTGSCHYPF